MKRYILILATLVLTFSCAGYFTVGSKNIVSKDFNYRDFERIILSDTVDAYVVESDEFYIKAYINENLEGYLEIFSSDNTLNVGLKPMGFSIGGLDFRVEVGLPRLRSIEIRDASSSFLEVRDGDLQIIQGEASDIEGRINNLKYLDIRVEDAATANLTGSVDKIRGYLSGASDLIASSLIAKDVEVNIRGASTAQVYASESIRGSVSEASSITTLGSPTKIDIKRNF